jgi:hypothetical protein
MQPIGVVQNMMLRHRMDALDEDTQTEWEFGWTGESWVPATSDTTGVTATTSVSWKTTTSSETLGRHCCTLASWLPRLETPGGYGSSKRCHGSACAAVTGAGWAGAVVCSDAFSIVFRDVAVCFVC